MQTEYLVNCEQLIMYVQDGITLSCQPVKSHLVFERNKILKYHFVFLVNWENYQNIVSRGLLYFDPDFHQDNIQTRKFVPEYDIEITTLLRPDLLPKIENYATNAATVAAYLQKLSQEEPNNLLLSTESWFLLSVEQKQVQGIVSYRTFWDYLNDRAFALDNIPEDVDDLLLEALMNFVKDSAARHLLTDTSNGTVNEQMLEASTQLLETLFTVAPSILSQDEDAKQQLVGAITNVFKESLQAQLSASLEEAVAAQTVAPTVSLSSQLSAITQQPTPATTIFDTIVNFFQQENWLFTQLAKEPILHIYFQGEHGKWECYAQAREAQKQFVFYSVLPTKAPEEKRQDIAEFLARANYGIVMGNFELDFSDGEIRYKTSIDVEGSYLDFAMLRQLVYSNVLNTNKYLPGIIQVINEDVSPTKAVAQIEG